jgi:hypothetical protein
MSEKIIEELKKLCNCLEAYVRGNDSYHEKTAIDYYDKLQQLIKNNASIRNALGEYYYLPIMENKNYYDYANCITAGIWSFDSQAQEIRDTFKKIIVAVKQNQSLILNLDNKINTDQIDESKQVSPPQFTSEINKIKKNVALLYTN